MKALSRPDISFNIEHEYSRCISALLAAGILSDTNKIIGIDGNEYPVPTLGQIIDLYKSNKELVERKHLQGFDTLLLTPLAMPLPQLFEIMKDSILSKSDKADIYKTRKSTSEPAIPVRINKEKHVWVWETLRKAIDNNELVYFPKQYSANHDGLSKSEVINNTRFCAFPGWSVALVESNPFMPAQGSGETLSGRKRLEIGLSPREYIQALKSEEYQGETGKTIEDFVTMFLIRLHESNEVSNDICDNNALWCLGQYLKIPYAEVVPTGRWIGTLGRVRIDSHRTGNKLCTKNVGASTVVRLS